MFSCPGTRRWKNAWDNRRNSDCSLVTWIFRISCNHCLHSHCPSCWPDTTCSAFRDRQNSKRVNRWPTPNSVGTPVPYAVDASCRRVGAPIPTRCRSKGYATEQNATLIFFGFSLNPGRIRISANPNKRNALRLRALTLLLRYWGLRISDAITLCTQQIKNGVLTLRTENTGTDVRIPMHPDAIAALDAIQATNYCF